jgi:ATP-dependent Clp protease ATP-binding subunit ClpA
MFAVFTEPARAAIMAAQTEAHERADDHLGCEHLLLGLLRGTGRAAAALAQRGVTVEAVRAALDQLVGPPSTVTADSALATLGIDPGKVRAGLESAFGPDALNPPPTPFDAEAKEALQSAVAEAARLPRSGPGIDLSSAAQVDPEHVLLGVLDSAENLGTVILRHLGVDCIVLVEELRGRHTGN